MKKILLAFISLLAIQIGFGQTENEYTIQWYNTENGLPSNGIKGLQWDPNTHFVWIATEAGIVRYNGVDLLTFTQKNTPAVTSERINFMVKNQKGEIFVADYNGNSIKIKGASPHIFHTVKTKSEENDHALYGLQVSESFFKNQLKNPIKEPIYLPFAQLANIDTLNTIILHQNQLWIDKGTASKINPLTPTEEKFETIFKIDNEIFAVTKNREIVQITLDQKVGSQQNFEIDNRVKTKQIPKGSYILWETGNKYPILINGEKAWKLTKLKGQMQASLIVNNLPREGFIKHIQYIEEFGMIVIGTDSKGIAVLKRKKITPIKLLNNPSQQRTAYYNQLELENEIILTNQGHLLSKSSTKKITRPIDGIFGTSLYQTSDSSIWFQQFSKNKEVTTISSYNYKTKNKKEYPVPITGNNFGVWESNKNVYIATDCTIEEILPERKTLLTIPRANRTKADPISVVKINNETVAIASCNGLTFYNTKLNTTDTILKLPNNCVRSLLKYKDYLLIGTYGEGPYVYKMGGTLNKIPLDKKRSLIYSHCFVLDSLGFCWISTNRGLLKARMDDLIGSYQEPSKEIYYHYYGIQDGMATSEMNGGCYPCAIQLKSGTLSFPTMDGLAWINPYSEDKLMEKGGLYIDEIIINKKNKLNVDSFPFTLPAFTKQISISLAYAAWSNLENIYIYYRLNNKDQWQELPFNSPSFLEINNLEPGSYQLQIRKLNGFGNDNFTLLSIPFVIDKPWYNKWWFYLIAITSGFGLIGLFLKIQTYRLQKSEKKLRRLVDENTAALKQQYEKLEKNNRIMSRLISIINHDIITPLKFIHVAGKNLLNRKTKVSEEINQETIVEITNTALELQDLSTNILNWIRYQQKNKLLKKAAFKPIELAEQVTRVLGSSAKIKYLELKINIEPDLTILQYAEPFRILIHNLVSNSIHFTEQGVIEIGLEKKNGNWLLWVKDNGVGMNQRQVENILIGETIISSTTVDKRKGHGLGYQIIKDLLELMEARIEIQSTKGIGTTVMVYFS